jgi:hypothetical protein
MHSIVNIRRVVELNTINGVTILKNANKLMRACSQGTLPMGFAPYNLSGVRAAVG